MTITLNNSFPVQNPGNGTAVTFGFPWKISAATDLVVGFITGGIYVQQTGGYTVAGVGNNNGGSVTFATAPPLGTTVDFRTLTPEIQSTEFANLTAYLPENSTNTMDRIVRMVQDLTRLAYTFGIHGPDQESVAWPALPAASIRANTGLVFDQNGLPGIGILTTTPLTQALFNFFLGNTPTPTNTIPLGSPTNAFSNLYLGPNGAPAFDLITGNIGFYARTAGEIAAAVTPVNYTYPPGWISRYGTNVSPGVTDMSTAIINMVNSNKGGACYIDSLCYMAGLIMSGSTYNGTQIRCVGAGMLKLKPLVQPTYNFDSSIWAGIAVQGCDQVLLDVTFDGNRTNQPQYEGIYCVAICGSTNIYCPELRFREIRGDGLYVDWFSPITPAGQANSQNVVVDYLYAYNTGTDGRNACSVISCSGLTIGQLTSYQVGGTINAVLEPGGLDLEPNHPTQSITDVMVGVCNVITAGGTGFSISGISVSGNDNNQDWNIDRVKIGTINLLQTAAGNFLVNRAFDVTIGKVDIYHNSPSIAAQIDHANRCDITLNIATSSIGLWLGANGFVSDSTITCNVNGYGSTGFGAIQTTGVNRTTIRGKVFGAAVGGNAPCIFLTANGRGALTQSYVTYSLDCPFDANANAVISNNGITIGSGTCLKDCNMIGFAFGAQATFVIPSYNCAGRNYATGGTTIPASGWWHAGDETVLDQTAGSTAPSCKCITSGALGTFAFKLYANLQP